MTNKTQMLSLYDVTIRMSTTRIEPAVAGAPSSAYICPDRPFNAVLLLIFNDVFVYKTKETNSQTRTHYRKCRRIPAYMHKLCWASVCLRYLTSLCGGVVRKRHLCIVSHAREWVQVILVTVTAH